MSKKTVKTKSGAKTEESQSLKSLVDKKSDEESAEKAQTMDQFAAEIEKVSFPKIGKNLEGKVLEVSKNAVYLDLAQFGVGVVRGRELWEALDSYSELKPGDLVEATVIEHENEEGDMELSFRRASREQAWKELEEKMKNGENIAVKIQDANRGGLLTMINGIQAFLPVSQLTSKNYPRVEGGDQNKILSKLQEFIGTSLDVQVITADRDEDKLIISEKKAEFDKQKERMGNLEVGTVIEGEVSGIVDFGAFIKFGELEGLAHISELAWQRIDSPEEVVKAGDKVKALVIGIDDTKVTLSLKRLQDDPWKKNAEKYSVGQVVTGKVTKIAPYGAFVQLDGDIHGLVHISELSDKKVVDPKDILTVGEEREFKILSLEPQEHRLGLSLKALEEKADESAKKEEKEKPSSKTTIKEEKTEK